MKRSLAIVLTLTMAVPSSAFAGELAASISRAVEAAASQARPNAPGQASDNPYFLPAVIVTAVGGAVTLYGVTHKTGYECSLIGSCGFTKSKVTIFTGLGLVGVGGYLFSKSRARSNSPQILIGPDGFAVRKQLRW